MFDLTDIDSTDAKAVQQLRNRLDRVKVPPVSGIITPEEFHLLYVWIDIVSNIKSALGAAKTGECTTANPQTAPSNDELTLEFLDTLRYEFERDVPLSVVLSGIGGWMTD